MSYVYINTESFVEDGVHHNLYTVGFYKPDGSFEPESDHPDKNEAAYRVHWLNGGIPHYELQAITRAAEIYSGSQR